MTRPPTSLSADYFERIFQDTADPWDLESSPYEKRKYDHSVAALQGQIYAQALEIGCAKGVLTQRLASQCGSLLAIDISETALTAARARLAEHDHIACERMTFPQQTPPATAVDLMVLSEVVYYWDDADIVRAADWIAGNLAPGGDVLLVHWTGETDYPQSGDDAVTKLQNALGAAVAVVIQERCPDYRLDMWRSPG